MQDSKKGSNSRKNYAWHLNHYFGEQSFEAAGVVMSDGQIVDDHTDSGDVDSHET